jgi:hypothetical protein
MFKVDVFVAGSAHSDAISLLAQTSPQWSPRDSICGIWSFTYASQSRSSQSLRVGASTCAAPTMAANAATAWFTAEPIAPEKLPTHESTLDRTLVPSLSSVISVRC